MNARTPQCVSSLLLMTDRQQNSVHGSAHAAGGLSNQTAHGFAWLLMQTVGIKCVTFGGQIILAWLLLPEDFGIVALAYSVATFIVIFQNSGVLEVLVQREKSFFQNANPAFWLSTTLGVFVALAILVSGPIAARVFDEPTLVGMLAVLACLSFLSNFEAVPMARLQIRMRFGTLAILGTAQGVLGMILSVIFALLGFGPYSFVVPLPIVMFLKLIVLWRLSDFPLHLNPEVRKWRSLVGATGLLIASSFFIAMTQQGANIVLGLFHGTAVVGIFYFAYHLTIQIQTLLSLNLAQVLLPSLSKLQDDPKRQTAAFLRVTKMLVLLGAPACFLLAAIADPFVRLVFADRWIPAIPVLQFLAAGLAFNITGVVTLNLIKAQGRYAFHLLVCGWRAGMFLAFIIAGALAGGAVEVGAATAIYMLIHGPFLMYATIQATGFGWRNVASVYSAPIGAAGIAAVAGAAAAGAIPPALMSEPLQIAVTTVTMGGLYLLMVRLSCPGEWRELVSRLVSMIPARVGRLASVVLLVPSESSLRK